MTLTVSQLIRIPDAPVGTRLIAELSDVRWEGERVRAGLFGVAAADWIIVGPEAVGTLDGRFTLRTGDGSIIFVQIGGRVDLSKGPGGMPSYVALRFEVGDPQYTWLNRVLAIAKGTATDNLVVLELFQPR
jgi:hypothetical protein